MTEISWQQIEEEEFIACPLTRDDLFQTVGQMVMEALGLSPVALLILTCLRVQTYVGSLRLSRLSPQTDSSHNFRAAPQTDLVTSACMLSYEYLCLDALHALSTYGSTIARSRLLFSLLFQV